MNKKIKLEKIFSDKKFLGYLIAALLLFILFIFVIVERYTPSKEVLPLEEYYEIKNEKDTAVIINGELYHKSDSKIPAGIKQGERVYLSLSCLKENIDNGYVYDPSNQILRYATDQKIITVNQGASDYLEEKELIEHSYPVMIEENDEIYLSIDFVNRYSDMRYDFYSSPNRIVIETPEFQGVKQGVLKKDTTIRRLGGTESKILKEGKKNDEVLYLEDYGKWCKILTKDGVIGCVKNNSLKDLNDYSAIKTKKNYQHILYDEDIVLLWHEIKEKEDNEKIKDIINSSLGTTVICPSWYYVKDNQGTIADKSSKNYVTYCHEQGKKVWGMVSNGVVTEVDFTYVLNNTITRDKLVNEIVTAGISSDLDGIVVDFKQLNEAAAEGYLAFIKELSLKCRKNDIVVAINNYVPEKSNMFYQRNVQKDYGDYLIVIAYDEHGVGSDEPGSVASIDYVTKAVKDTLKEVPNQQLILGIPFYTRLWETNEENVLTSTLKSMNTAEEFIAYHNLEPTWWEQEGQFYAEMKKEGITYQIWLEEKSSIERKLEVSKKENLAGVAFWKSGYEKESIWSVIQSYMGEKEE